MKKAGTPAGIFAINKVKIPSAYTCVAEQKKAIHYWKPMNGIRI